MPRSRAVFAAGVLTLAVALPAPGLAELPRGAQAPDFTARGALAGKPFTVHLAEARRRGPVVLYFYPKAFTQGCTLEAHAFAEASDDFRRAGATVIGMSADDLPTLQRFSSEACRDRFAVASASSEIIAAYDVALAREGKPSGLTKRTSYVIDRQGRIAFVHSDMDYRDHVQQTLAAVKKLARK